MTNFNKSTYQNLLDGTTSMLFPQSFSYKKTYESDISKRIKENWKKGISTFNASYLKTIKKEKNDKRIS